ncbi:hypothetical protein BCD48_42315 [Pseudofrankia sp. BMG5.36]|nr:hypothetical protein BCD48_42315 [Pseudofrankia sp. BMG5.36]
MHGETPVIGLGLLTLDDLALRSEKAHADHMATYTASQVLHLAFMAEPEFDQDVYDLVEAACGLLREYREKTRQEWRDAYRTWATAAGIDVPDEPAETTDTADSESEV